MRTAAPDRTDGVDDVLCRQTVTACDPCLSGRTAADAATLFEKFGTGGTVNRTIDSAAAEERGIRGVDDRIDVESGDAAAMQFDLQPDVFTSARASPRYRTHSS